MAEGAGFSFVTDTATVAEGPCLVHSIVVTGSGSASGYTLYDGLDAESGRELFFFGVPTANQAVPCPFPKPLRLDHGLYVVKAGSAELFVQWESLRA